MQDGTLKIARIEDHQPAAKTPAQHTITYVLDGFTITSEIVTATPITEVIARLKAIGATPAAQKPASLPAQGEAPTCEFHGKMKESTARPGTWFCPKKMGDGSYCKSKA